MTAEIADANDQSEARTGFRKGVYILPNMLTIASLFFGFSSIVWGIHGLYDRAAYAILIAAVFDGLDGTVARITRTQSLFGQELDSLSDMVSFGVAPGLLMYLWALEPFGKWGFGAGFLYFACTCMRLARFNVQAATVEKKTFQGLPSPGAAAMIATTILLYYDIGGEGSPSRHVILLAESYAVALLMVSNVPYPSTKALRLESVKSFQTLFLVVLALSLFAAEPDRVLFLFFFAYVLSGPVLRLRRLLRRNAAHAAA